MMSTYRNVHFDNFDKFNKVHTAELYLFLSNAMYHVVMDHKAWDILRDVRLSIGAQLKELL